MIEMVMFFGLGFFTACLATVFVANAVWRRAVRLTTKRVQAAMPISLAEIKADRDQLRADFAMSTRKLEMSVEDLKQKMQGQVSEIAKKNEQLRLLLAEVKAKSDALRDLEAREQAQRLDLLKSEGDLSEATRKLRDTEKKLNEAQLTLAERDKALATSQTQSDERRVELAALNSKISQLQHDISHLQREREALQADHNAKHEALSKTERALSEERAVGQSMATKIEALEKTVQAQAQEVGQLQAKISELTAQLRAQMTETERAVAKAQSLLSERSKMDDELARRTAEAELRLNNLLNEMERTRSDRASLEGQLAAAREERNRLATDLKQLKTGASENWERERSESAMMRERLNDITSEIGALGSAITGEDEELSSALGRNLRTPRDNSWSQQARMNASDTDLPIRKLSTQEGSNFGRDFGQEPQRVSNSGLRAQVLGEQNKPEPGRKLTLAERMRRLQERSGL